MFCFFPASFISSTYTDKNSPCFSINEQNIPNLELFPNRVAFPKIVVPEDDRTDVVREEPLGLPYWTMI